MAPIRRHITNRRITLLGLVLFIAFISARALQATLLTQPSFAIASKAAFVFASFFLSAAPLPRGSPDEGTRIC